MKKLTLVFLIIPALLFAQVGPDEVDYHAVFDKIYREHIPLDGNEVNYIPFRKDSLYGFVEKHTMKEVVKPQFSQVFAVYPEGAILELDHDYYQLAGYDGKIKGGFGRNLFREGSLFHGLWYGHDTARKKPLEQGYIGHLFVDSTGKKIFEVRSHKHESFGDNEDYAWFRYDWVYSVYDRKGKKVKQFPYDKNKRFLGIFNNILVYETKDNDKIYPEIWVGTDVHDKEIFRVRSKHYPTPYGVGRLNDTLFMLHLDGAVAFVNPQGDPYPFDYNTGMSGFGFGGLVHRFLAMDLIRVHDEQTNKWGMLRSDGKFVVPVTQTFLGDPVDGEFAYLDESAKKIGFMNANGEITVQPVLPPELIFDRSGLADERLFFSDGLLLATTRNYEQNGEDDSKHKYFYIDKAGKVAISLPDSFILAGNFSEGLAPVVGKSRGLGFIDKTGKLVIPCKYEAAVGGAYPFPYVILPEFKGGFAYIKAFKGYIDNKGREYFSGKRIQDHYDFSH